MTRHVDLLFAHQPTKFSLRQDARRRSVLNALSHSPVFCGFTEGGQEDDRQTIVAAIEEAGYVPVSDQPWEPVIAVSPRVTDLTYGGVFVHGGRANVPGKGGGFQPRHVAWASGRVDGNPDLEVTFAEWHSITVKAGEQANRLLMARTVGQLLREKSVGHALAVGAGDLNEADKRGALGGQAKVLDEAGLVSLWDELGHYPDTFDSPSVRAIDWMLRNSADERAVWVSGAALEAPDSDHDLVLGKLRVLLPKAPVCGATFTCVRPVDEFGLHGGRHRTTVLA